MAGIDAVRFAGPAVTVFLEASITCLCPVNGLRDHGMVEVEYLADDGWALEYSAFAALLAGFAGRRMTHEQLTGEVLAAVLGGTAAIQEARVTTRWQPVEGVRVRVHVAGPEHAK
jgi:NADPH-dependent 7-cyano-7-deazaguanine reductase QueF